MNKTPFLLSSSVASAHKTFRRGQVKILLYVTCTENVISYGIRGAQSLGFLLSGCVTINKAALPGRFVLSLPTRKLTAYGLLAQCHPRIIEGFAKLAFGR